MSVSIRLAKFGKKNAPSYRVVATKTRTKRNGEVLETLGHFDPSHNPAKLELNNDRIAYWKGVGAVMSTAVSKLMAGDTAFVKYAPKSKKKS
ncbi:MAG: 30S ribosomal protein S16 [candidate division WWE3 bacterium]|nr:30S ribosomal protein S16 [candidate division WWE3 bacterium]